MLLEVSLVKPQKRLHSRENLSKYSLVFSLKVIDLDLPRTGPGLWRG